MWWIIGVVLIGGLLIWWLANLRGHPSNRLLEVSVATVDGDHYEISYDELRPDVKPVEYVRLALMFAAKMLYNMGDTDAHARQRREFLDTLGKVGSSESGRTVEDDLLSGLASHIAVDEVAGDPSGREIRATLALVDTATRSVYTRLPATWHEYQFLDSWLAILRTVQSRIDDRLTRHLHSSLRRLHELYRSGDEDPMSLSGLASAPNRAFLEAEAV